MTCKKFDKDKKICYDNITYVTNTTITDNFVGLNPGDADNYVKAQ